MTASHDEDRIFERLLAFLRQSRGFDFTGYKRSSLKRRVRKRIQVLNLETFEQYLDYLEVHPEEFTLLFNTILINVTCFFRDREAWQYLQSEALPSVLAGKSAQESIRVWSAGCSSGEEPYTAAMILAELLDIEQYAGRVKIYATDVDQEALLQARQAIYSAQQVEEQIPDPFRSRYLEDLGNGQYRFRPEIRNSTIFGRHDLVQDAPISRVDLLMCRNTLMYFNSETQKRILARLHFALKDTGVLFLGKAEMLLSRADLFAPINLQYRIFQCVSKVPLRDRLLVLAQSGDEEAGADLSAQIRLHEAAFNAAPIAQLVIDNNGILVLANSLARTDFALKLTDLGKPLRDLEISYRPLELRSRIEQASAHDGALEICDVEFRQPEEGSLRFYDVTLTPLRENGGELIGTSITFAEVTRYHQLQTELQQSQHELEAANKELQSSNEELETTNEELQSTNEELETTNEELQSTNEELETMNEELQSSNEELQAMNDELRMRTIELDEAKAFLTSILASLQTGVIIIDRQANILIWNGKAEDLWGLRADEVEGTSLLTLDIGLPVRELHDPIRSCITDAQRQELILEAVNALGRHFTCRVNFNPLIGSGQELQGVILLTEEIDSNP